MSDLRRLRPLILPKGKDRRDPGTSPQPILLKTSQLRINDTYQRQLSRDSSRLAIKIAAEFDWELYHLLVVSLIDAVDETTGLPLYEVLDGQHTGIAAVTNGHVREVWCWPGRTGETAQSRAESFDKLNTQRTAVTPVELFWSKATAGKEEALEVLAACEMTGAKIIKRPKPYGNMEIGETICTAPLMRLAKIGGRPYVERVLRVCMNLRLTPISQMWIYAIEILVFKKESPHYLKGNPADVDMMIETAVNRIGQDNLFQSAKMSNASSASAKDRWPVYWWLAHYIHKEVKAHATG